jgi:hypothetical protein
MTPDEAHQIEQAAIILLRHVQFLGYEGPDVRAALRTLKLDPGFENRVSFSTARELLERTAAWRSGDGEK